MGAGLGLSPNLTVTRVDEGSAASLQVFFVYLMCCGQWPVCLRTVFRDKGLVEGSRVRKVGDEAVSSLDNFKVTYKSDYVDRECHQIPMLPCRPPSPAVGRPVTAAASSSTSRPFEAPRSPNARLPS